MYRCFIASPNDTQEERDSCEEVFLEINKTIGEKFKFRLESVRWEKDANPSMGREPQGVINDQLFDDIDIFIGILSKIFGTPTENYGSGTEEEFYAAYKKHVDSPEAIEIKMYFNNALEKPNNVNIDDLKKINKFKDDFKELGGLYCEYDTIEGFKKKFSQDMIKYLLNIHDNENEKNISRKLVQEKLSQILQESLINFEDQNVTWIDRMLCDTENLNKRKFGGVGNDDVDKVNAINLIDNPHSMLIYAQPQFGLTCLSHYLVQRSWEKNLVFIYLNAEKTSAINCKRLVEKECHSLAVEVSDIQCIILDAWSKNADGMVGLLRFLCKNFPEIRIVIMSSDIADLSHGGDKKYQRNFDYYTLLPLTQNNIRGMVENYNSRFVPDDNKMLIKIVDDLFTLNLPRTPLNCLTLLKIAERNFNEEHVNRTKMVHMILTLLFDFTKNPHYSTKPDMEHCEFLLGYFCEKLIRNSNNSFTKNEFINDSLEYIKKRKVGVDVHIILDTLVRNRIIIEDESICKFRHMYWIYYFAANRMHQDPEFYDFIVNEQKYTSYVEIIDFYTGINRNEDRLVQLLTDDLKKSFNVFEKKVGLEIDFNPLDDMRWVETTKSLKISYSKIKKEILNSNLPDDIKDRYADKSYDYDKPSNQNLPEIYEKYSLLDLVAKIRVCSRALRNSEFIEPNKKTLLLNQILRSWQLLSKLFFVLSPLLARKNVSHMIFDGMGIIFPPELKDKSPEEYLNTVLAANPGTIVKWFQDDLHSDRLSQIFEEHFYFEKSTLIKHQIIIFIINNKPNGWKDLVFNYVKLISKNSFYLLNIQQNPLHSYQYKFLTYKQLSETRDLIEIIHVKKITKSKHLIDASKSVKSTKPFKLAQSFQFPNRVFKDE